MSDYQGDTSSNIKATRYTAVNVTFAGEAEQISNYGKFDDFLFGFVTAVLAIKADGRCISPWAILLNSRANIDILCNKNLLADIHIMKELLKLHCNAGEMRATNKGYLKSYGWVCYSDKFIANISSLSRVSDREGYHVCFDNRRVNEFVIEKPSRNILFTRAPNGLYQPDMLHSATIMVTTVDGQRQGFTKRQYEAEICVCQALSLVVFPSRKELKSMVRPNLIPHFDVTVSDIDAANIIFGPGIASLRGKTVRKKFTATTTDYDAVPKEIKYSNREVTIASDVMFVNGMPFLFSILTNINLTTADYLTSRRKKGLSASQIFFNCYNSWGLTVTNACMDEQSTFFRTIPPPC